MKKLVIMFLFFLMIFPLAFAWDDCVHGEIDCTYPGDCGSYTDTNQDYICDHSQDAPITSEAVLTEEEIEDLHDLITGQDLKTKTVEEVAEIYGIDENIFAEEVSKYSGIKVFPKDSFEELHNKVGYEPSIIKEIAESIKLNSPIETQTAAKKIQYHPIEILLIVSLLYFLTWFLTKRKKLSIANHRKMWNIALLVSFILTAVFGIFMTTQIAVGWPNWNIRGLHVDPGMVMATISIYHILWHIPYLKQMFKFIKKQKPKIITSDKQASESYDQTESSK